MSRRNEKSAGEELLRADAGETDEGSFRRRAVEPVAGLQGSAPRLPDPVTIPGQLRLRSPADADGQNEWPTFTSYAESPPVREGCYFIRFTPILPAPQHGSRHYDGTIRMQVESTCRILASGDLYLHEPLASNSPATGEPDPADGIPIFPLMQYHAYIRVVDIRISSRSAKSFDLDFEMHRFHFHETTREPIWTNAGLFTAHMEQKAAPFGYPSSLDYYCGEVTNAAGDGTGTLTMGWVSSYLRRAVIEIDKVKDSEWPLDNGAGVDWHSIFALAGWDVSVVQSNPNVPEPGDGSWSNAEIHAAMLDWRDSADLNSEWRYHLLCVRRLDEAGRGIMYDCLGYDNNGADSNNLPREGAAVASHWEFWDGPFWGSCSGKRFGEATAPYFRTAVHEIGHAMCLCHPLASHSNHLMQDTLRIARNVKPPQQFPDNIQWRHAPEDQKLLRHMPDIGVRPGGISFDRGPRRDPRPDASALETEGPKLHLCPLLDVAPMGAPVPGEESRLECGCPTYKREDRTEPGREEKGHRSSDLKLERS